MMVPRTAAIKIARMMVIISLVLIIIIPPWLIVDIVVKSGISARSAVYVDTRIVA